MADENTVSKADYDNLQQQLSTLTERLEASDAKNAGLLDDLKKAQREARAAKDITPEAHQAEIERADKAEAANADLTKQITALTKERDTAVKALETESTAARGYALEKEILDGIAAGNVVPALVPAFKALLAQSAKADLVDGKYAVTIGDKPASEYIKTFLEGDDGKAYRAATPNGGGNAPGGANTSSGKDYSKLPPTERISAARADGLTV